MSAPPIATQEKIVHELEGAEKALRDVVNSFLQKMSEYGGFGRVTLNIKVEKLDGPGGPVEMELERTVKINWRGKWSS